MEKGKTYISRQADGEDLYSKIQHSTLDELQHLSGDFWTDYNPHDPGVTIADAANYALTELAYKLGFELEDYLTESNGYYAVENYGLYPPDKSYPVSPVTADDYLKLILANFPMAENVKVETEPNGTFNFHLRLTSFFRRRDDLAMRVRRFFHEHRNLCENIGEVSIAKPKELLFAADIELALDADPTNVLVQIYYTAMQYLAGSVCMKSIQDSSAEDYIAEEWYDGPVENLKVLIPEQKDTETELYWRFMSIDGIESLKTCYFYELCSDGSCGPSPKTDFKDGYTLVIPKDLSHIKMRIQQKEVTADIKRFKEGLHTLYFTKRTSRMRFFLNEHTQQSRDEEHNCDETIRKANYRNIYEHYPIENDFPRCYRIGQKGLTQNMTQKDKDDAQNFGEYLKLFDLIIKRGLIESDEVKRLLSLYGSKNVSRISIYPEMEDVLKDKPNDYSRDVVKVKSQYLDFLDAMYGVNSELVWLKEFGFYGETTDDYLLRRMKFLQAVPELLRNRYKAGNIEETSVGNVATIKKHISLLLGFNCHESIFVGNILPSHNLILMGDSKEGKQFRDRINSMLVNEKMLDSDTVSIVTIDTPPVNEEEKFVRYEDLRRYMPIFNTNWISGGLFRHGIDMNNYKLVKVGHEYLLVFWNEDEDEWMNLARSNDREKLEGWTNTLRRYLQELNRQCEAVYVIEKSLFEPTEPFTVAFVFTGWTTRTYSTRFRALCEQLVRSLLPAHLKMETYWLDSMQMQYFEECYHNWRRGLNGRNIPEVQRRVQDEMMQIVSADNT